VLSGQFNPSSLPPAHKALQKSADDSGRYSIEPPIIGLVAQAREYRIRQIDLSERDANTNLRKPTKRKRKVP
jgi:hypothetical protein